MKKSLIPGVTMALDGKKEAPATKTLISGLALDGDWDESKHKRAANGQFGSGGGGSSKEGGGSGGKGPDMTGIPVIVTGNVNGHGQTGVVESMDSTNSFAVVKMKDGTKKSFHMDDLSENDEVDDDDDDDNFDPDDPYGEGLSDEDRAMMEKADRAMMGTERAKAKFMPDDKMQKKADAAFNKTRPNINLSKVTAHNVNKHLDKLDSDSTKLNDDLIFHGHGNLRQSEILKLPGELGERARRISDERESLMSEIERRYGSRVRRLPIK